MCVCFSRAVCGIPAWLSVCLLSLVVWQCFSGPLIQYDHFTVPGGKSRYSAQHTQHTQHTKLPTGLQGTYRMRWAVLVGPRCRYQAQILDSGSQARARPTDADLGVTSSKGFPAKPRQSGCEPASQQSLRGMEASIDFSTLF